MACSGVISAIESRIAAAEKRYGPFASTQEALGVACEEWDELRAAIHSNNLAAVTHECIDLAAALIRLARHIEDHSSATSLRSIK